MYLIVVTECLLRSTKIRLFLYHFSIYFEPIGIPFCVQNQSENDQLKLISVDLITKIKTDFSVCAYSFEATQYLDKRTSTPLQQPLTIDGVRTIEPKNI